MGNFWSENEKRECCHYCRQDGCVDFWSWMQICTWNGVDIFGLAQYRGKICEYQIMLFIYHIMGWRSFRSSKLHLCWFFWFHWIHKLSYWLYPFVIIQASLLVTSICNYTGQLLQYICSGVRVPKSWYFDEILNYYRKMLPIGIWICQIRVGLVI